MGRQQAPHQHGARQAMVRLPGASHRLRPIDYGDLQWSRLLDPCLLQKEQEHEPPSGSASDQEVKLSLNDYLTPLVW